MQIIVLRYNSDVGANKAGDVGSAPLERAEWILSQKLQGRAVAEKLAGPFDTDTHVAEQQPDATWKVVQKKK